MDPATVGGAGVGAWILEKYGKEWTDRLLGEVKRRWDKFNWDRAARQYRQSLRDQHSTIRIFGKSEPVSLEGIFTDAYILDEVSARQRYDIDELRKRGTDRIELRRQDQGRLEAKKLIEQGNDLFILGKPGAGKTTFLRYITLLATNGYLNRVPVFLSLNEWSMKEEDELMPSLIHQFDICNFPDAGLFIEHLLREGKAIVLFDGLDEVHQEGDRRRHLTLLLNNFAKKYRNCMVGPNVKTTKRRK